MTFTVSELQLLQEALQMAASRCDTYARCGKRSAFKKHADKAERMLELRSRLSALRPRRDLLEVA
jgi:hypothetical protein